MKTPSNETIQKIFYVNENNELTKIRKIKLKNNKNVLIDESAEIKINDYYSNNGHILKCDEIKIRTSCSKIIVTINHSISLDLPMLIIKDDVTYLKIKTNRDTNGQLIACEIPC